MFFTIISRALVIFGNILFQMFHVLAMLVIDGLWYQQKYRMVTQYAIDLKIMHLI